MITSLILFFAGVVIQIVGSIFAAISFTIPNQIIDAISFWFSKLHQLDFILPMDDVMTAFGIYLTFIVLYYTIKVIMWAYHIVRHGGDTDLPLLGRFSDRGIQTQLDRAELMAQARERGRGKKKN